MAKTGTGMTAEELLRLPDDGKRYELVEGELKEMAPAGGRHGSVAATLAMLLGQRVRGRRLGVVLAAETGFRISRDPETVRAGRLLRGARAHPPAGPPEGYWDLASDLAAEVVSPNDTAAEIQSKVQMWLDAGTRLVWVLYPNTRSVMVYESSKEIRVLAAGETLRGGNVVPGFEHPVAEIFE